MAWFGVVAVVMAGALLASGGRAAAERTLPGGECRVVLPDGGWSVAETWAWGEICAGRSADMRRHSTDGQTCNPAKITGTVPAGRVLSARFLRLVLTRADLVAALERPEVKVQCAQIGGALDLQQDHVVPDFGLFSSHLPGGLNMLGARFDRSVYLNGSALDQELRADRVRVAGGLFLRGGATVKGDVRLLDAQIGGDLDAIGSTFEGAFRADRAQIDGEVFLRDKATVKGDVRLLGARVGGSLSATGSTFEGAFRADGAQIDRGLFLRDKATVKGDVRLLGARVGGDLDATGSTFEGAFRADGAQIDGEVFLRGGARFAGAVNLIRARIGGNLQLGASRFDGPIALDGASIDGAILLSSANIGRPAWGEKAELRWRNASAGALQAELSALKRADGKWLPHDLVGFRYDRLGGLAAADGGDNLAQASAAELIAWIERRTAPHWPRPTHDQTYAPQPYMQLADALDRAGATHEARALRYGAREHKRRGPDLGWLDRAESWLSKLFIGYGIYPFRVLWWFGALVVAGALVGRFSRSTMLRRFWTRLWFSLENALPLVEPQAGFRAIRHNKPWVEGFFHFQKVAGFVLATILVGALTLLGGP
jgi:hypothetical protein